MDETGIREQKRLKKRNAQTVFVWKTLGSEDTQGSAGIGKNQYYQLSNQDRGTEFFWEGAFPCKAVRLLREIIMKGKKTDK